MIILARKKVMTYDITAFETLYKEHYNTLCNTADNIVRNEDESHDIVQEVFLKFWNKKSEHDTIVNKKAYLVKSVINASLTYLEKNKRTISLNKLNVKASETSDSPLKQKELENKIQAALEQLPPKCRTIFALSRFEEMKYKEIAEHLGISVKTVENQMGIALKKMRQELSPYISKEFMAIIISIGIVLLVRFLSPGLFIFFFWK